MASGLSSLAIEIIELIATALDPTNLCSFRGVCKELNRKLQNISEATPLKYYVQCLHVGKSSIIQAQHRGG